MALEKYNKKRDFRQTPEPKGKKASRGRLLRFVVQKHDASHLHYDFRLEMAGDMKSWAVPKGPSLNPKDKRLAMQVEDHPISYNTFEGTIPQGQYGGGDVIVWDNGYYHSLKTEDAKESEKEFLEGLKKGKITFIMKGKKLKGEFGLVRFKGKEKEWMLVKKSDEHASEKDITLNNKSVLSKKTLIGKKESPSRYKRADLSRVKPMLATLVDKPFSKKDWIYEIKWDGYRAVANISGGKVDLYSRNFNDFKDKYPSIVERLEKIKEDVILDGEIVAYDKEGNVGFQALQNIGEKFYGVEFMIFDILHFNGEDLTPLPLIERKKILRQFLKKYKDLKESDYIEEKGEQFFKLAVKKDLEGIIAKSKDSPYVSNRRTDYWLKIKNHRMEEAVIAGFTEPRGSRKNFGALVLGVYKGDELVFAGHTGTGFSTASLGELYKKMKPLVVKSSPFKTKVPINSPITWIKPKLVAQIKFAEWTKGGAMRQAVFLGLRDDKPAKDVEIQQEIPVKEVLENDDADLKLTNLDKIYFPESKITKGEVIEYYRKIAPFILPYLKDRPESLNRHPNGINKPNFFQKNFTTKTPSFVKTEKIHSESTNEEVNYLVCQNEETLLYMANLGCIEINPWNSRVGKLNYPDYMIFDLDPKGSTWPNLIKVAKEVKSILDDSCQHSFLKTSGKSGLHICVPLGAKYKFEDVRNFTHLVAQIVHKRLPNVTSLERDPKKRKNKIYLDYLQNRIGQTTASVYSLRPTKEASVSTPLKWSELTTKLDPKKFTMKTIHQRLSKVGDLFKPVIKDSIDLKESIMCLEKSLKKLD
jgi:bifunctional non-homologous end joining protein LigD